MSVRPIGTRATVIKSARTKSVDSGVIVKLDSTWIPLRMRASVRKCVGSVGLAFIFPLGVLL